MAPGSRDPHPPRHRLGGPYDHPTIRRRAISNAHASVDAFVRTPKRVVVALSTTVWNSSTNASNDNTSKPADVHS